MSALKFAANLSWLYTELPFLDRFAAAARDGFTGVECLFPHEHPTAEIQARLSDLNLQLVLFNAEPGDWAHGDRGLASLPGRQAEFQHVVREALVRAVALGCPRIHIMAGLPPPGHASRGAYSASAGAEPPASVVGPPCRDGQTRAKIGAPPNKVLSPGCPAAPPPPTPARPVEPAARAFACPSTGPTGRPAGSRPN